MGVVAGDRQVASAVEDRVGCHGLRRRRRDGGRPTARERVGSPTGCEGGVESGLVARVDRGVRGARRNHEQQRTDHGHHQEDAEEVAHGRATIYLNGEQGQWARGQHYSSSLGWCPPGRTNGILGGRGSGRD